MVNQKKKVVEQRQADGQMQTKHKSSEHELWMLKKFNAVFKINYENVYNKIIVYKLANIRSIYSHTVDNLWISP